MDNLQGYMKIREAAELLGVSPSTLRNWGREGKMPTHRHPINGYRLYRRKDLERLLSKVAKSAKRKKATAS